MAKSRKTDKKTSQIKMSDERFSVDKRDIAVMLVMTLIAFGIRLYFLQFSKVISADGTGYANAARAFLKDGSVIIHFGAVYPILVAFMEFFIQDIELSGRLVSMIMGSLLVVPVYLLALEFFNKRVGVMACLLVMVWPSLRAWSGEVMTQATYITLTLMGVYLIWRSFRLESRFLKIMAGVIMALAYMTRPEAIAIFVAMLFVLFCYGLVVKEVKKELFFFVFLSLAGFMLVSFPYFNHIHNKTGEWQVAGKTGTALKATLAHYLNKPDLYNDPNQETLGYVGVMKRYPGLVPWNIKRNLNDTWNLAPTYIWVLCMVGFLVGRWDREGIAQRLFLLTTFSPYAVIIVFFFVGPEYIQPYLPVMFLWVCHGLSGIEGWLASHINDRKWDKVSTIVKLSPISLVVVLSITINTLYSQIPKNPMKPYHYSDDGARYDRKKIGLLLKEHLPKGSKIMTRWGRIYFYADMKNVGFPQDSARKIFEHAIKNKVDFIVIDGVLTGMRPQLAILFKPFYTGRRSIMIVYNEAEGYRPFPWLKLHLLYKDPSSVGVAVYEILYNEIKY